MNLVTDQPNQPPVIWKWLNERINLPWSSDLRTIGMMRDDGTIACAVGYNGWGQKSCWMHVAFDGAHGLKRDLWRAAFAYPFNEGGLDAIYGLTPKTFDEALKMNKRLGFRQIAETVDSVILEMTRDECKWLKEKEHVGKRVSTSGA